MMSPGLAEFLADSIASSSDSERVKRLSLYLLASSWPDSPIKIICLIFGDFKIS